MSRGHVDVTERRLKPIYEALDSHNNKKAIQLADKLLKKQDLHCAKVLKSLALLRSGKDAESWALIQDTKGKRPLDDATLNAMSLYFKEARKPECIVEVFELAVKDNPTNEEYMTHLFMAYVRLNEYKKQQHVGLSLYKLVPKNPYYYWAVMSLVMQAQAAEDPQLAKKTLLPLAERMIEKHANESKMESEAELRLYVMVLRLQNKHETALQVLTGKLSEVWKHEHEKNRLEREILWTLKQWPELNQAAKKAMKQDPDDWSLYQLYLDSVFGMMAKQLHSSSTETTEDKENSSDLAVDSDVTAAWKFLGTLVAEEKSKTRAALRGPLLAQIELVSRSRVSGLNVYLKKVASPMEMLYDFYELFGDRACCYSDLEHYLRVLDDKEQSELLIRLAKQPALCNPDVQDEPIDVQQAVKVMQRHICSVQLARSLGLHLRLSVEDKKMVVGQMMEHFRNGVKYGEELLETEVRPNDAYALLAAHVVIDIASDTDDAAVYWDAIAILEEAYTLSPANSQIRLLLVRLYSILGIFDPCAKIFNAMEIRNIQLDTIGYYFLNYAPALGYFKTAQRLVKMTLAYFFVNKKDGPEYVTTAYKSGSFHKILEIVQFQQRVQRSISFPMTVYDVAAGELLIGGNCLEEVHDVLSNTMLWAVTQLFPNLVDNRDARALDTWDPLERRLSNQLVGLSFELDLQWLKVRSITFRLLYLVVSLLRLLSSPSASSQDSDLPTTGIPDGCKEMHLLSAELQAVVETLGGNSHLPAKFPVQGPPESRIIAYLDCGHAGIMVSLVSVAIALYQAAFVNWTAAESEPCQRVTEQTIPKVVSILEEQLQKCKASFYVGSGEKREFAGACLQSVVLMTETFVHMTIILAAFCQLLESKHSTKRQKKKGKTQAMLDVMESVKSAIAPLHTRSIEMMQEFKSELDQIRQDITADKLVSLRISSVDDETVHARILKHVRDSYDESLQEITDVLDRKLKVAAAIPW